MLINIRFYMIHYVGELILKTKKYNKNKEYVISIIYVKFSDASNEIKFIIQYLQVKCVTLVNCCYEPMNYRNSPCFTIIKKGTDTFVIFV